MRKISQSQRLLFKDNVVKKGPRVRKKMYGVLFVCGVTRAIYPDYNYSTESVLHCIRRLMAERGSVSRLISDPGTQLKGASNELTAIRKGWSEAELVRFGAKHGITWEFVMASSQHQNDAVEILIKICKEVMKALMAAIGFFPTLIRRQKWHHDKRNVKVDDVCMLKDANAMRGEWRMSRVVETYPDEHGKVRNVKLKVPPPKLDGKPEYRPPAMSEVDRHVKNIIVIVPNDDEEKLEDHETAIAGSEELSEPADQPLLNSEPGI